MQAHDPVPGARQGRAQPAIASADRRDMALTVDDASRGVDPKADPRTRSQCGDYAVSSTFGCAMRKS